MELREPGEWSAGNPSSENPDASEFSLRDGADLTRYAAATREDIGGVKMWVRISHEPMHVNAVLPWLESNGLVYRKPAGTAAEWDGLTTELVGWGDPFFAVPFDRTVQRTWGGVTNDTTTWRGRWRQMLRADNKVVYHYRVRSTYVRVPWLAWAMFS